MPQRIPIVPSGSPARSVDDDSIPTGRREAKRPGRVWTVAMVETSVRSRASTPDARLLAIFEVFDELFNRADAEAQIFVAALTGMAAGRPLGVAGTEVLLAFRSLVDELVAEAALAEPEEVAFSLRILMNGSILRAAAGDLAAGRRAREMAADLMGRHRVAGLSLEAAAVDARDASALDFDYEFDESESRLLDRTSRDDSAFDYDDFAFHEPPWPPR
jgi:hypothetical protein